ncbi:tyrosine-type recombinase/integrase [Yinghuangia seranimata]|uniref:tyrosine-type recombinase/integrase n=1 Tax=Yinghuangia seranimata TaxID=408067 RepID=UPI00248D0350|nr:tyrosine-type recombinase/integrase [Yinghuangia seranimata]MDI2129164.1 tyrosine-type recombinase/integrase [Yinghuangia seranimata]
MAAPRELSRVEVGAAVREYADVLALRVAMGALAASTASAYVRDVEEFARLVGSSVVLDDVESSDVELAVVRIANAPDLRFSRGRKIGADGEDVPGRGLHARARWLASVRGLFRWARQSGYVRADPMELVAAVRVPTRAKGARLGLSVEEAVALRESPPALPGAVSGRVRADQRLALRDEVILRLLTETGPRVSELCAANADDVRPLSGDGGGWVLHIRRGKGGKARDVPLSEALVAALAAYREGERPAPPASDPVEVRADAARALVVTVRGRRMCPRDVQRMVARHVRLMPAGLRQAVTPHGLRHTAATVLLRQAGADVGTVADILGHGDVSTTSVYLDASVVAAAEALGRSPLAR